MATSTLQFLFSNICQQSVIPTVQSASGWIWFVIKSLWPWYWFLISILLVAWVIYEIITRHGRSHYNSENGFSPSFNSFVGSGMYAVLQYFTHLVLDKFYGPVIYCKPWSYVIHIVIFLLTGGLLILSGFWVYWKLPGDRRRRN